MSLIKLDDYSISKIFEFLFELPISLNNGGLFFAHTCSRFLHICEKNDDYQFHKFLQFYCMGNKCNRYDKIENYYKDKNKLKKIIPIIFYLNFPSLNYLKKLTLDDILEIENIYRNNFNISKFNYEDYLFKIDRIIEMIVNFVNFYNSIEEKDELFKFNEKDLLNILLQVDQIINESFRLLHWKAFQSSYFEDLYLTIPKKELPNIYNKYQSLNECLDLLKNVTDKQDVLKIELLIKDLNIFYCDKLAYYIHFYLLTKLQYKDEFINETKYLNIQGVHQSYTFYKHCPYKRDHELITHLLLSNPYPEVLIELPEDLQLNKQYLLQIIRYDTQYIALYKNKASPKNYEKLLTLLVNDRELLLECFKYIKLQTVSYSITEIAPPVCFRFFNDVIMTYKNLKGEEAFANDLELKEKLLAIPFESNLQFE
ncbi:hypothetical protein ABK040_001902 [Willaertia magna]